MAAALSDDVHLGGKAIQSGDTYTPHHMSCPGKYEQPSGTVYIWSLKNLVVAARQNLAMISGDSFFSFPRKTIIYITKTVLS